jgi:hypothetical protein
MQNGTLMLKDDDYAVQPASGRGGGGGGAMVPVSATAMVGSRDASGAVLRHALLRCGFLLSMHAVYGPACSDAHGSTNRLIMIPLAVCVCVQASPAQYPLHDVRVHDDEDDDDTPMPMPITADESNLFQVGGQAMVGSDLHCS